MSESPLPRADLDFAKAAAELAANTRCTDVVLLDVSERSQVTHYFLIATGTSPRQMTTVAEQIAELGEQMGFKPWRTSGAEAGKWILIDCVDVVVHLFDPPSRAFYDLEMLWGDCPKVELDLPPTMTPQDDQTAAAMEAIQEVIDAALDTDDELILMDVPGESSPQDDDPSLQPSDDAEDTQGIAAPPDDHAISYESVSIDLEGEGGRSRGAGATRTDKAKTARQKAPPKKAKSGSKPKPAAKAKAARKPKTLRATHSGIGKEPASRSGNSNPKPMAHKKRSTASGKTRAGKLKSKTSTIKAKVPGKQLPKAQTAKTRPSRPRALIKKASKGKAAGKMKTVAKPVKPASTASRTKSGGSKKTTAVKKRK